MGVLMVNMTIQTYDDSASCLFFCCCLSRPMFVSDFVSLCSNQVLVSRATPLEYSVLSRPLNLI